MTRPGGGGPVAAGDETETRKRKGAHFEVETRHDGELLHRQLFGGFLVTMATAALDFGTASQMLWPG